jgi:hypothetical protein
VQVVEVDRGKRNGPRCARYRGNRHRRCPVGPRDADALSCQTGQPAPLGATVITTRRSDAQVLAWPHVIWQAHRHVQAGHADALVSQTVIHTLTYAPRPGGGSQRSGEQSPRGGDQSGHQRAGGAGADCRAVAGAPAIAGGAARAAGGRTAVGVRNAKVNERARTVCAATVGTRRWRPAVIPWCVVGGMGQDAVRQKRDP